MSLFVLVVLVSMHNSKAQELQSHLFDFSHGPFLHVVPLSSHKVRKSSHTGLQGFSRYKHLV